MKLKIICMLGLCLIAISCKRKEEFGFGKTREGNPKPALLKIQKHVYALRDSFETNAGPMEYSGAVLYRDARKIDTAFSDFGFSEFGIDSIIYQRIYLEDDTLWDTTHDSIVTLIKDGVDSGLYFYDGPHNSKTKISNALPYYHSFSSPSVSNDTILYWGVVAGVNQMFNIYAMRYLIKSGKLDSVYLFQEGLETDNTSFFPKIRLENRRYIYLGTENKMVGLDSNFNRIK